MARSDWDLETLLARGYFPKELPPPFTTRHFAAACCGADVELPDVFESTKPTRMATHILGLAGGRRRVLGIPNPISQFVLAGEVRKGWKELWASIDASAYSLSKPRTGAGRALAPLVAFQDVPRERAPVRARGAALVRVDVAQFYPSVYTHAVPWALHGKDVAKRQRGDSLLGNRLDTALRGTQDGQTMGIPIGPDTSLVFAELLLSRVDQAVSERFAVPGTRHMDDYEFAVVDATTAERVRAGAQELLADFELGANPEKTNIVQLPQLLERPWIVELRHMQLSERGDAQYYELVRFHDRAVELARSYPTENVLKYALGRLDHLEVDDANIDLLLAIVLQFVAAEYGVMPNALPILERVRASDALSTEGVALIEAAVNALVLSRVHARVANDVAWGLWAAIRLQCSLGDGVVRELATVNDSVVALLGLHARDVGLTEDSEPLKAWSRSASVGSLSDKAWLLAYEGSERGWLGKKRPASGHEGFSFLAEHGVRFYEETASEDEDDAGIDLSY